jgi:hypothetical protein
LVKPFQLCIFQKIRPLHLISLKAFFMTEELTRYYGDAATSRISLAIRSEDKTHKAMGRLAGGTGNVHFIYNLETKVATAFRTSYAPPDYLYEKFAKGKQVAKLSASAAFHLGSRTLWADETNIELELPARLAEKDISFEAARDIAKMFKKIYGISSKIPVTPHEYDAYIADAKERLAANAVTGESIPNAVRGAMGGGRPARALFAPACS